MWHDFRGYPSWKENPIHPVRWKAASRLQIKWARCFESWAVLVKSRWPLTRRLQVCNFLPTFMIMILMAITTECEIFKNQRILMYSNVDEFCNVQVSSGMLFRILLLSCLGCCSGFTCNSSFYFRNIFSEFFHYPVYYSPRILFTILS